MVGGMVDIGEVEETSDETLAYERDETVQESPGTYRTLRYEQGSLWGDLAPAENENLEALAQYRRNIHGYIGLTIPEERRLASAVKRGDTTAKVKLFLSGVHWIQKIALTYTHHVHTSYLEDLIQSANLAVWSHLEQFDPQRGRFTTWSQPWAMSAIRRTWAEQMNVVHIPEYVLTDERKIARIEAEHMSAYGTTPDRETLAEALGVDLDEMSRIEGHIADRPTVLSADMPLDTHQSHTHDRPDASLGETLMDEDTSPGGYLDPVEVIHRGHLYRALARIVRESCSPREQQVLWKLFDTQPMTLDAIGTEMGISRERVRQIKEDALRKIRRADNATGYLRELYELAE